MSVQSARDSSSYIQEALVSRLRANDEKSLLVWRRDAGCMRASRNSAGNPGKKAARASHTVRSSRAGDRLLAEQCNARRLCPVLVMRPTRTNKMQRVSYCRDLFQLLASRQFCDCQVAGGEICSCRQWRHPVSRYVNDPEKSSRPQSGAVTLNESCPRQPAADLCLDEGACAKAGGASLACASD